MKKLFAIALCVLGLIAAEADTPVPEGFAVYDITLNFTEFAELDYYGDWPVHMNLIMGTIYGQRVYVDPGKTQIVVRATADIGAMIDTTATDAYKAMGHQMKIGFYDNYFNLDQGGTTTSGQWTGTNLALDFSSDPRTLEAFSAKLTSNFWGRKMNISATYTYNGTGNDVTFKSIKFDLVRKIGGSPAPNRLETYNVALSFNQSPAVKDFSSVTNIDLYIPNLYTIRMSNPEVEPGTGKFTAKVDLNVSEMIAAIVSDEYKNSPNAQSKISLRGLDGTSEPYYMWSFVTGLNGKVSPAAGDTEIHLGNAIRGVFMSRDRPSSTYTNDCRLIDFSITRIKKGMVIIVR